MDFQLSAEQQALKDRARRLADEKLAPIAAEIDESDEVRWDVVKMLADANLFQHVFPEGYGGTGIKVMNACIIREELCRVSGHADNIFAMQGLGSYPISLAGTHEQKLNYLPPVARGERVAAFGLTEPEAGSDVSGMQTTARLEGDEYVLDGMKRFISNAGDAQNYVVFAKTDPKAGNKGISAFIVERGTPGFAFGPKMKLMAAHPIGELLFNNCRIPKANLLDKHGEGFKIAMKTLDVFRSTVGAAALGIAQGAFESAVAYAKRRVQFGQSLSKFQAIQFKIADMIVDITAARFLIYNAATAKDSGAERVTLEAAMAKLFATETAHRVCDQALQIHGGNGVWKNYAIERLYREERALRIYEGASEVQRMVIASQVLRD